MRLFRVTLVLGALFVMIPARSDAWFGMLDRLRGPGPYFGEMFDFRLVCFGRSFEGQELGDRLFEVELVNAELASALVDPNDPASRELARSAWQGLVGAASASAIPRLRLLSRRIVNVTDDDVSALYPRLSVTTSRAVPDPRAPVLAESRAATLLRLRSAVLEELRANMAANSVGVLWSFCGNGKTRSVSIDMAADFWWAEGTSQYARGHSIRLLMLMPSLSWRVIKDPRYDVLGFSAGGGMYAYSSRGFNDFTGIVLQPARVNLHFPSDWTKRKVTSVRGFLSLFNVHYGVYTFPAGFEPNAFNGVGTKNIRIPAELVQTASLFVNWEPRFMHWNLH